MTIELPIKLKQRMAKGKFVIVGRAGMDLYPKPANKQTSQAGTFISDLGGSAANIAVSISKLYYLKIFHYYLVSEVIGSTDLVMIPINLFALTGLILL